jgi:uncharacterized membrane protein
LFSIKFGSLPFVLNPCGSKRFDLRQCREGRTVQVHWIESLQSAGGGSKGLRMSIGDWLFDLTERLRDTPLVEFSLWVSDWPLALWLQSHFYAIPAFQTVHILAIAALFGSTVMLNMRVLGLNGKDLSLADSLARYRPWTWYALLVLVVSGIILLISEPVRNMINPIFWIKMGLLAIAVLFSLWFQRALRARTGDWDISPGGHASLRLGAVALTLLWCAVMAGGRWIAYAPV